MQKRAATDKPGMPATAFRACPSFGSSRLDAEIALQIAPTTVDVIGGISGGVLLDVQELDEEGRSLNVVGVRLAGLLGILGEGEVDLVHPTGLDLVHLGLCHVARHSIGVGLDQLLQNVL